MEIGEKIYGFEVKEKKYVREVEGDIIQMEHLSTGAQVVVIDNQDVKKSFLVGFRTIPKDSTGVFHILEHSVLNGSRRYPDKTFHGRICQCNYISGSYGISLLYRE